jgi:hypothetical protein
MENFPSIFVTDSNIWIDLHHGKVTTHVFKLPYRFITTDFIYEELKQPAGADLMSMGLETRTLDPDLILEMIEMIHNYPRPSRIDISGLVLALYLKVPLLSGDGDLRKAAGREGVRLHGTLFLLDKMVAHRVIKPTRAAQALNRMLLCRSRLPEKECAKRFDAWGFEDK